MSMGGPGAGFMLDAINRMKYNRSLLKRKSYFEIAEKYRVAQKKAGLSYKESTPEDLQKLRQYLIMDRQRETLKKGMAMLVSVLVLIAMGWVGNWALQHWPS